MSESRAERRRGLRQARKVAKHPGAMRLDDLGEWVQAMPQEMELRVDGRLLAWGPSEMVFKVAAGMDEPERVSLVERGGWELAQEARRVHEDEWWREDKW